LKGFHPRNPEDTKIAFFDNIDIPNVDKLSLYGPDPMNTSLFEDYGSHGMSGPLLQGRKDTATLWA
jgi:hypothetical protein